MRKHFLSSLHNLGLSAKEQPAKFSCGYRRLRRRRGQRSPLAVFFLKLSRNSSRSWDWLGGGSGPFWSLEKRSLSDQEGHRVPLVPDGRAISVSPTLVSENRASICFRSRSDTASPFKVMISLPFLSPGRMGKQSKRRERDYSEERFQDERKLPTPTVCSQGLISCYLQRKCQHVFGSH